MLSHTLLRAVAHGVPDDAKNHAVAKFRASRGRGKARRDLFHPEARIPDLLAETVAKESWRHELESGSELAAPAMAAFVAWNRPAPTRGEKTDYFFFLNFLN